LIVIGVDAHKSTHTLVAVAVAVKSRVDGVHDDRDNEDDRRGDWASLFSAYFQAYLTHPDRAPSSPAVWTAWSAAETIGPGRDGSHGARRVVP